CGPASAYVLRPPFFGKQVGRETGEAERAVVACQVHTGAGCLKVLDTCGEVGGSNAVIEPHALDLPFGRPTGIAARAEQIADRRQERGLPNPAGNERDVASASEIAEAVSQWAPN